MASTNFLSNVWGWTIAERFALQERDVATCLTASGRGRLRCDAVTAPLDLCCGVFDELARIGGPVPPMAQLGDRMLFLVRVDSVAAALASPATSVDCKSLGIEMTCAEILPGMTGPAILATESWILPLPAAGTDLPSASTVLTAIRVTRAKAREREGAQWPILPTRLPPLVEPLAMMASE